ncbi:glycosyltransferase [Ammoniphilus sp. YIM 78166]|uniref:glycosyltransferase n=1 Tax=Ammoniphilus sp. YIM 78166 TaxID=1644106 RepID=UPI00107054B7|nr:glycosyltransferase [Ammoniphilus sp. YIM 78166]
MRKKCIIFNLSFNELKKKNRNNGQDHVARLTKPWIDYRMSIFMKYTCKSFKAQTNQDFIALIKYDPQSDKHIQESLNQYDKLPANIQFIKAEEFDDHVAEHAIGSDFLYLVRLDSDDMYHRTFVQQLHDAVPKEKTLVLICSKGYKYDCTNQLLSIDPRKSPPFYTLIYKTEEYLKGVRYLLKGGHPGAIKLPHEYMPKQNYVYIIHNRNIRGTFNQDKVIEDNPEKIKRLLKRFTKKQKAKQDHTIF